MLQHMLSCHIALCHIASYCSILHHTASYDIVLKVQHGNMNVSSRFLLWRPESDSPRKAVHVDVVESQLRRLELQFATARLPGVLGWAEEFRSMD